MLEQARNYVGDFQFKFLVVGNIADIPGGFSYTNGFLLARGDTACIMLISRIDGRIATNSWDVDHWIGWKIFTGTAI